jgi:hypothetical protein
MARRRLVLEVRDRVPGDQCSYPADDLQAVLGEDGKWQDAHKDDSRTDVPVVPLLAAPPTLPRQRGV